jgi:hypothetical protein
MIDSNPFAYLGRHWEYVPVTMEVWAIGLFLSLSVRLIRDRKFLGILRYEWYLSGKQFFKITPSRQELQVWEGIERRKHEGERVKLATDILNFIGVGICFWLAACVLYQMQRFFAAAADCLSGKKPFLIKHGDTNIYVRDSEVTKGSTAVDGQTSGLPVLPG